MNLEAAAAMRWLRHTGGGSMQRRPGTSAHPALGLPNGAWKQRQIREARAGRGIGKMGFQGAGGKIASHRIPILMA